MTDAPSFLRRRNRPVTSNAEPVVRDIIASLRSQADLDVAEVLASAINVYTAAIIRFRGNDIFHSSDVGALLSMWEILLNTSKQRAHDYSGGKAELTEADLQPNHSGDVS